MRAPHAGHTMSRFFRTTRQPRYFCLDGYAAGHGPHSAVCSHRLVPFLSDHHAQPHGIRSKIGSASRSRTNDPSSWFVNVDFLTNALRLIATTSPISCRTLDAGNEACNTTHLRSALLAR